MAVNYATFELIQARNERDVQIEDITFRVRGILPEQLMTLVGTEEGPAPATQPKAANVEAFVQQMDDVLIAGMVVPGVATKEDAKKLGRFRMQLFRAILDLSGLSDAEQQRYTFL